MVNATIFNTRWCPKPKFVTNSSWCVVQHGLGGGAGGCLKKVPISLGLGPGWVLMSCPVTVVRHRGILPARLQSNILHFFLPHAMTLHVVFPRAGRGICRAGLRLLLQDGSHPEPTIHQCQCSKKVRPNATLWPACYHSLFIVWGHCRQLEVLWTRTQVFPPRW